MCAQCGRPLPPPPHGGTQVITSNIKLVVHIAGQAVPREYPLAAARVMLGRTANNDIVIAHPFVSGAHAQLDRTGTGYRITDLKSTNGLLLNGHRITTHDLANNDLIRIGDAYGNSVTLEYIDANAPQANLQARLNLAQTTTLIGRDPQAQCPLNAPTVSWHHARIDRAGSTHVITDLGSTNGTFVNGARVTQPQALHAGDVIQIGPYQLAYDAAGLSQSSVLGNVRLDALHLNRAVRVSDSRNPLRRLEDYLNALIAGNPLPASNGTRLILNDVSLTIQPREFVALVGASGAGKSTLMNALSGFKHADNGTVLFNGADLYRDYDAYRSMLGYVPQQDIIHRGLPVENALRYAARLRLPPDSSDAQINQRVQDVMQMVEITQQRRTLVCDLSGGQLKRVSIAAELLAQPALFFLDEPTSGLDPGLEKKMMYTLRRLADQGQTIILVTHATANINQCSKVAFMAGGRLVFFGAPNEAKAFFQKPDFSDIYTELARVDNPQQPDAAAISWEAQFKQSPYYARNVAPVLLRTHPPASAAPAVPPKTNSAKASPVRQWWILTQRNFELIVRDKLTLFILLAVMPLIAILAAAITKSDALVPSLAERDEAIRTIGNFTPYVDAEKLLFIVALASVLLGVFAGAYEIIREQAIYRRERMINLGIVPYVLSKITVLTLFSFIQAALLLGIIALKVRLPTDGVFLPVPLEMYLTLVLTTIASITLGLCISSLARSDGMVIYIILVVLFVQILFAGAIFTLPKETESLAYITTTHWTLNALGSTVDMRHLNALQILAGRNEPTKSLPVDYQHNLPHLFTMWGMLLASTLLFTALTCLRQKMKDEL